MKILKDEQIRAADAFTIKNEPIKSVDLMERAAEVCSKWIIEYFHENTFFKVVCGTGNNGGDGLAIARLLHDKGYRVEVFILPFFSKVSDDFIINRKRLEAIPVQVTEIKEASDISSQQSQSLPIAIGAQPVAFIDAILGSGLSKPVEGKLAEVIERINSLKLPIIAIDMPSGLMMEDNAKANRKGIISATFTLTFEAPKLSFFFAENAKQVGEFFILDIGLDKKFIAEQKSLKYFLTEDMILPILRPRARFSHKGTYGHALIIAGGFGKMGAAVLAAKACLRAGAGLLTVHIPNCGYEILQSAVPEAMAQVDAEEREFSGVSDTGKFNAIGIGPGIGQSENAAKGLKLLIQNAKFPLVIDADALNILSENKTWLSFLPKGSILTPHPGEFARLVGKINDGYQVHLAQIEFAVKHSVYLVLKGAYTAIATPEGEVYFNSTGNPGMAKGGSGDALTGVITGLLAQGYTPKESALFGVYLHGLAGDIAANEFSREAMIAEDITNCLGNAFKHLWEASQ
jgi:NAD(P)H-hydrate epimerase